MDEFHIYCLLCIVISLFFFYCVYQKNTAASDEGINLTNHPVLEKIRENFGKIDPRYRNVPLKMSERGAYTEDKKFIAMCIRDPDTKREYDFNEIMFVSLHELAHYISKGYGHGNEFIANFEYLLRRARSLGLYRDIEPPDTFCGA